MEVLLDTLVRGRDGTELGTVDFVLFDPSAERLLGIVVGGDGARRVLPAHRLQDSSRDELLASTSREEFQGLNEYREADYREPNSGWKAPYPWVRSRTRWPLDEPYAAASPTSQEPVSRRESPLVDASGEARPAPDTPEALQTAPDPYDVLQPPAPNTRTLIERDDASNVNPQERPD